MKELNARNLKESLWETLNEIRSGKIDPAQADAIASQAREILRTANTQLRIFHQAKESISSELIDFAKNQRTAE